MQSTHCVQIGHRPSSASRVFNAATMRVRLRHGEVAKRRSDSSVGFTPATLANILRASSPPKRTTNSGQESDVYAAFPTEDSDPFFDSFNYDINVGSF